MVEQLVFCVGGIFSELSAAVPQVKSKKLFTIVMGFSDSLKAEPLGTQS